MLDAATTLKNMPTVVRVAAFDIQVERWNHHAAVAASRWGEFSGYEQIIRVSTGIVSTMKIVDTFMHELGHALWWAYRLEDADNQERIVSTMGVAWAQVYRDNQYLLTWLEETLHGHPSAL